MLTRVCHARDWASGIELRNCLLGKTSSLQVHHIFPKSLLYDRGFNKSEVNAVANFTFLTQDTNLKVSNRDPKEYLKEYSQKHPGAVASHWIPTDPELWKDENYLDFLSARRELLAKAANDFLNGLYAGTVPKLEPTTFLPEGAVADFPGGFATEDEENIISECNEWVVKQGLPAGEVLYELVEPNTKEPMAVIDLAWPDGLQPGLSQPVALLIGEEPETEEAVNAVGYRFFNDPEKFRQYVLNEIMAIDEIVANG